MNLKKCLEKLLKIISKEFLVDVGLKKSKKICLFSFVAKNKYENYII